ncbi:hypothetical protein [Dyadobacter tibetensis]|uniref:hypothetical protein n=1 Tax=Dyadobacter tibetensis TaxID=1211851 RepID=UPI000471B681|nr:hypothetical protein [Dyadobacter tibetensis]
MRIALLLCFLYTGFIGTASGQGEVAFYIKIEDGGIFDVRTIRDSLGQLQCYEANIKAPVCEDRVCYDVNIRFRWNLIGQFEKFVIAAHDPLTKMDHEPFAPEDYKKLQQILSNQDLSFVHIPKNELVTESDSSEVDGYTGATKATVKKEVIEGALYTCYTLWHIANGEVVDAIRQHTHKSLNRDLIKKMLSDENQFVHYYLINWLDSQQMKEHIDDLLMLISEGKGYFSKNAIEQLPELLFETLSVQNFIISHYNTLDYYAQLAILKKLKLVNLGDSLRKYFIFLIQEDNGFQNQRILSLVLSGIGNESFTTLVNHLNSLEIIISEENFLLIEKLGKRYHHDTSQLKRDNK